MSGPYDVPDATRLTGRLNQDRAIDEICRHFETVWATEQAERIESCVAAVDPQVRDELLFELIVVEIELRQSEGQSPARAEYLTRFPANESIVQAAFDEAIRSADSTPARSDDSLPSRFGEFRVVREIGHGGMGVVYEAEQESLRRRVAVKSLLGRYDSRSPIESRQRFLREARAIARLHHSNIVDVFGDGEQDGVPYFAMRFIDGSGLDRIIANAETRRSARRGPHSTIPPEAKQSDAPSEDRQPGLTDAKSTPPNGDQPLSTQPDSLTSNPAVAPGETPLRGQSSPRTGQPHDGTGSEPGPFELPVDCHERSRIAAQIGRSIASALQYAHDNGVLHRDVKPSNILIDRSGTPWLTDFGLARLSESETVAGLTLDGSIMGTLRYLPPESLAGTIDERADQYSLGLVLFELLALRPAYDRVDKAGLLRDIENCARPSLESLAPEAPRDLITIIQKALDREPSARYATVGELGDDLERFLNDEPIRVRRVDADPAFVLAETRLSCGTDHRLGQNQHTQHHHQQQPFKHRIAPFTIPSRNHIAVAEPRRGNQSRGQSAGRTHAASQPVAQPSARQNKGHTHRGRNRHHCHGNTWSRDCLAKSGLAAG